MNTFRYRGFELPLFDHPYNATITNERALEIPIALDFLARGHGAVLEVGNVMEHYFTPDQLPPRAVADRYELQDRGRGIDHDGNAWHPADVFALHGPFDTILSVSTVEHVRWDELGSYRNPFGGLAALLFLRGMLAPGGSMLATWPWGYARGELDRWLDHFAQTHSADEWVTYVREEGVWDVDWPEGHDVGLAVVEFRA